MKAKYIGKWCGRGYDRNSVYLEYEYRGMKYVVHEDRAKGNEPLSWQHKAEQDAIDKILDVHTDNGTGKEFDINEVFEILGWD